MTPYTRADRVGLQVSHELAHLLLTDVRDPAITGLTVTHVKMSSDLRVARVYYSLIGDELLRQQAAAGLERAKGFLRRAVGEHLKLRYTPELHFHYDPSMDHAQRIDDLLRRDTSPPSSGDDGDDDGHGNGDAA